MPPGLCDGVQFVAAFLVHAEADHIGLDFQGQAVDVHSVQLGGLLDRIAVASLQAVGQQNDVVVAAAPLGQFVLVDIAFVVFPDVSQGRGQRRAGTDDFLFAVHGKRTGMGHHGVVVPGFVFAGLVGAFRPGQADMVQQLGHVLPGDVVSVARELVTALVLGKVDEDDLVVAFMVGLVFSRVGREIRFRLAVFGPAGWVVLI